MLNIQLRFQTNTKIKAKTKNVNVKFFVPLLVCVVGQTYMRLKFQNAQSGETRCEYSTYNQKHMFAAEFLVSPCLSEYIALD